MRKGLFVLVSMFFAIQMSAQTASVNDFKYVIVPKGYDFTKKEDAYQLNSLSKFLFNKYGFTAFLRGEELPKDLYENGCKALTADVQKKPGFLTTKLVVELKDCKGTVVFTSKEGTSREKEFKKAYHGALRDAFKGVEALRYAYNEKAEAEMTHVTVEKEKEVPVEKNIVSAPVSAIPSKSNSFLFNGKSVNFKKEAYGFLITHSDSSVLGKAYKTSRENSFIVQGQELNGIGYFDGYGNLVLERVNPATNKVIVDTFARQ